MSILTAEFAAELKTKIEGEVRRAMYRETREKRIEMTKEQLAARAEFVAKWKAMNEEGEQLGYLYWTNDYPGSELTPRVETFIADGTEYVLSDAQWDQAIRTEVNRRYKAEVERIEKSVMSR